MLIRANNRWAGRGEGVINRKAVAALSNDWTFYAFTRSFHGFMALWPLVPIVSTYSYSAPRGEMTVFLALLHLQLTFNNGRKKGDDMKVTFITLGAKYVFYITLKLCDVIPSHPIDYQFYSFFHTAGTNFFSQNVTISNWISQSTQMNSWRAMVKSRKSLIILKRVWIGKQLLMYNYVLVKPTKYLIVIVTTAVNTVWRLHFTETVIVHDTINIFATIHNGVHSLLPK